MSWNNNLMLMILLGDIEQVTGAAKLSQQFVRAVRQHVPPFAMSVLSLDEATCWYWGAYPKEAFRTESWRARLDRNLRYTLKILQIGMTKRPRFVFCLSAKLSVLGLLLKRMVGCEYVVYAHDPQVWLLQSGLMRKALEQATWAVTNSGYTRRKLLEQMSLSPDRIVILPPAVDGSRFRLASRRKDLVEKYGLDGHSTLMVVGRLDRKGLLMKRQDAVVKALTIVVKKIPDVKCLFVGPSDGSTYLRDLATECELDGQVTFVGGIPQETLSEYYNLCDLFVLPSKCEPFGMVYVEALSCGKPVIGGVGTGAEDALLGGQLGLLVDPDDVPGLAEAIVRMLKGNVDPHLLDPTYLRETVLDHYGFERFTERVGELLVTILGGSLK